MIRKILVFSLVILSIPAQSFAQNYAPLSPLSKYSCLLVGSKNQVVIPNSKGYKLANFSKVKDEIKEASKGYVQRRTTLRGIRAALEKEKALNKSQNKAVKQLAKKLGFEPPDPSTPFNEQIAKVDAILAQIDIDISIKNTELDNLNKCKQNQLSSVGSASRIIDYVVINDGFQPKLWVYALYSISTSSKEEVVSYCFKQWLGQYAGKFVLGLFRKNPCAGLDNSDCASKVGAGQRGMVSASPYTNYTDFDAALAFTFAQVEANTPASIEIGAVPASGNCSDYDK